jgi:hypothetical protein
MKAERCVHVRARELDTCVQSFVMSMRRRPYGAYICVLVSLGAYICVLVLHHGACWCFITVRTSACL